MKRGTSRTGSVMWLGWGSLLLAALGVLLAGAPSAGNVTDVVAANHWAYAALHRLAAGGLAPLWATTARPLSRIELAAMVAHAEDRLRRNAAGAALRRDLEALRVEFAEELRMVAERRQSAAVRLGVNVAAWSSSGPPPRSIRHGGSGVALSRLYLGGVMGSVFLQAGRDSLWWGPGGRGAFVLSDNGGSLDFVRLSLTGDRIRFTKVVATLSDPPRFLYGLRLDWQAGERLRLGFSEAMIGADGLFVPYALNPMPVLAYLLQLRWRAPSSNDNYSFAFDFDWMIGPGVLAYGEFFADDLILTPDNPFPHRLGGTVGLFLRDPFGDGRTSLRLEHARASNWIYATVGHASDHVQGGRALGFWCAPDCEVWSLVAERSLTPAVTLQAGFEVVRKGEGQLGATWIDPTDAWSHLYLSGVVETTHNAWLAYTAPLGRHGHHRALLLWSAASNAGHLAGQTRQDWFAMWEVSYGL